MNRISKFYKVSFEQFLNDWIDTFPDFNFESPECVKILEGIWENISIPKRSTANSAGYDFVTPTGFELEPGQSIKIPTGIKCQFNYNDWMLTIHPRSSLGFKYQIGLANTTGIIDSDYINADNEGHIMISLKNCSDIAVTLMCGERIAQGIFLKYLKVDDDSNQNARLGGFGSTN